MKGQIFNLLESFIIDAVGADKYEQILVSATDEMETKCPFVGPGTYPDTDFFNLLKHALQITGLPLEPTVVAFGEYCFTRLHRKLPRAMQVIGTPTEFLQLLDSTIHVEVKKVSPGAEPPSFEVSPIATDKLLLKYTSKRNLFDFVEGMLQGLAKHYKVGVTIERTLIQTEPIGICEYLVTFN